MSVRILAIAALLALAGFLPAQEPAPQEPWPLSKLELGRPVQVARFTTQYSCSVFPVSLEFLGDQVHLVYLAGRRSDSPKLFYQKSPDGGRTWEKPVPLDDTSMAHACRDGDTLWIVDVSGDTGGFRRYGTEVHLIKLDLKTGRAEAPRTILGAPNAEQDERSYGTPAVVAHGTQMSVGVLRDHRPEPGGGAVERPLEPLLLTSADAGVTWKEHSMSDVVFTGNASVACWPLLLPGGPSALLGTGKLTLAQFDRQDQLHEKPLALPEANAQSVEPFRMASDGKQTFLAFAEVQPDATARLFVTTSPDSATWTRPVSLAAPIQYELITPFSSLSVAGRNLLFGFTASKGNQSWISGDMTARLVLSRDGAATFERVDIAEKFRYGSTFPVAAMDPEGKRFGCAVVALVPRTDDRDDGGPVPPGFDGEAYLLFIPSPPFAPEPVKDAAFARRVEDLVRKLGAAEYQERERATTELQKLGESAIPFLEQALQDPDMEISTRARLVLRQAYPPWLKPAPRKP